MRDEQLPDDPLLATTLDELRSWGTRPAPEPSPALMALFADTPVQPAALPPRRRIKMLTAKLAGLGLAAKLALGAGVATAAVTTAGVTGVLPGPGQLTGPSATTSTTVLGVDGSLNLNLNDVTDLPDGTEGTDGTDGEGTDGARAVNHGLCVSTAAKDKTLEGREHGKAVSEVAKSDCGKTSSSSTSSTSTTSSTLGGGTAGQSNRGPNDNANANASNRGPGSANSGGGGGNSGSGSSGNRQSERPGDEPKVLQVQAGRADEPSRR